MCMVLFQEVDFILAPGQELYSLTFDVIFTNNIALSYFIGESIGDVYSSSGWIYQSNSLEITHQSFFIDDKMPQNDFK